MRNHEEDLALLMEMLTYKRPHQSLTEEQFLDKYIRTLPNYIEDTFGNGFVEILSPSVDATKIMWSCHTDTVHTSGGKQFVYFDRGHLHSTSNCLGADNTLAVWLMHRMIAHEVPGLYVFHRGEERGRLGSEWIAHNTPNILEGIEFAIAFDRRNTHSIITHQMGRRSCSDDFARQLGKLLKLGHQPDSGGIYTDTASYVDLIAECTNVSAGYNGEHTSYETQDVAYAQNLLTAVLSADFSQLVAVRSPEPEEDHTFRWAGGGYAQAADPAFLYNGTVTGESDFYRMSDFVYKNPDEVASFLQDCGISLDNLREYVERSGASNYG
jgi:hypothetical protein